jgi:uncharacterized membrane protein YhaH (DUF805 family)
MTTRLAACFVFYGKISRTAFWIFATLLALFGHRSQSPYLAIANRQAEIMMRIASEFGFTPASRSRISAPPKDQLPLFDAAEPKG